MGSYLNPGGGLFSTCRRSKIYVDKSGLISKTNDVLGTEQRFVCVSRPRRFGKSMAANMLAAYYGRGEDTEELFADLKIREVESFRKHLNQYDVIRINMQEFLSITHDMDEMLSMLQKRLLRELKKQYPEYIDGDYLIFAMKDVFSSTKHPFVILIDEWDCVFREFKQDTNAQKKYLDFLRAWLKDQEYVALAYMTGILPVKKYGSHSALNMFTEYSMLNPREMAEFFGFTENEVKELCLEYKRNFQEAQAWYDGYELVTMEGENRKTYSMYSPKSVVDAMLSGVFDNYWNQTETYEALKAYIRMDDVLTLLVHLGYLSYHWPDKTVSIPNKEVSQEYVNAISTMDWKEVIQSIEASRNLLEALWQLNAEAVANGIDQAHQEISILQYNDENALSCTISLAFYFAREYYTIIRELPTGKGFADLCFIPRRLYADKPAAVIELKWDKKAEGAISQIKNKGYVDALKDYHGDLLLAGINYDKKTKKHTCVIEKYNK